MRYTDRPCSNCDNNERKKLMSEINKVSFAVMEMVLYLDTHPYDKEAIRFFNHYSKLRNELLDEYSKKFTPLTVDTATDCKNDGAWDWALEVLPWRGGCA